MIRGFEGALVFSTWHETMKIKKEMCGTFAEAQNEGEKLNLMRKAQTGVFY